MVIKKNFFFSYSFNGYFKKCTSSSLGSILNSRHIQILSLIHPLDLLWVPQVESLNSHLASLWAPVTGGILSCPHWRQGSYLVLHFLTSRTVRPPSGGALFSASRAALEGQGWEEHFPLSLRLMKPEGGIGHAQLFPDPLCLPKFSRLNIFWFVCISTYMISIKCPNLTFIDVDLDYDNKYQLLMI